MNLKDAVRTWLIAATTAPIVHAWQNAPRPKERPYIALALGTAETRSVHYGALLANGSRTLYAHRVTTVELQAFGDDPHAVLDALLMQLAGDVPQAKAVDLGLSLMGAPTLQNVPILRDGVTWEPRAIAEIRVGSTSVATEGLGWIETVEVDEVIESVVVNHMTITAPQ